jgi:replicative DNA helicase
LKRGNIYSLTAPSGAGKSTILINYVLPSMLQHNERCCMFINEEDVKKVKKELLLYCCTNILKHPIQKVQLRDGHFDEETLQTLHKAADWLEEQDKNHNLIVIPLEHYTTDIVIKLIKKYKNLFDIDYFILDTFKESSDSKEEGYREMLKSSVKLYDLIKPACLNVCLVMSMQTSKSSLRNRHLTNMDIGQSKSVVDVFSVSLLCRRVEPDEYKDEKNELKCFRIEGKTKLPFTLDKEKYYMLFFIAKNRFGNTDAYSVVSEIDLSTNRFKDIGYCVVPEDWR